VNLVLLFSGGIDSTVLLYQARGEGHRIRTLSIDYGQKHRKEVDAAKKIADINSIEHKLLSLSGVSELFGSSALVGKTPVPRKNYDLETMKKTVVPNRNMVMISLAVAYSISGGNDGVAYAAHRGDHAVYPDCREEFIDAMKGAIELCDWKNQTLYTPFTSVDKAEIVRKGGELGVPFDLTWSCYEGGEVHCGECGTCRERRLAFEKGGVKDPTEYAPVS